MLVLTSAAGFYLGTRQKVSISMLFVNSMIGIALLAFGVATLNQFGNANRRADGAHGATFADGKNFSGEALVFGILLVFVRGNLSGVFG
jgi:heme O synthase-like polyprenyltransferase